MQQHQQPQQQHYQMPPMRRVGDMSPAELKSAMTSAVFVGVFGAFFVMGAIAVAFNLMFG